MMVAQTFYQKSLPNETMERLQEKDLSSNKNRQTSAGGWWFFTKKVYLNNGEMNECFEHEYFFLDLIQNDAYAKSDTPTSDTTIRPNSNVETPKTEPIPFVTLRFVTRKTKYDFMFYSRILGNSRKTMIKMIMKFES